MLMLLGLTVSYLTLIIFFLVKENPSDIIFLLFSEACSEGSQHQILVSKLNAKNNPTCMQRQTKTIVANSRSSCIIAENYKA